MLPKPHKPTLATHWGLYHPEYQNGKLSGLQPFDNDPDPSPIAAGMVDAQEAKARIGAPSVRSGFLDRVEKGRDPTQLIGERGKDTFVELPWDEALDIAAAELNRIRTDHGNQAIFGGSYGWASAGRFHHAQSQVHRFLNCTGGYTSSVHNYSYGAADVIVPHVIGSGAGLRAGHTSWPNITEHTETLVLFGGLPHKNSQINAGGVARHTLNEHLEKLAKRKVRVFSISPLKDDTEMPGVEWVSIIPGTDTALMLGMAHSIIIRDLHAKAFLTDYTVGYDKLESYILGQSDGVAKSAQWASDITGVPAQLIDDLALTLTRSRSFLMMAWAVQRARYGEQPCWMQIALAAILGQIGLPGGGFGVGYGSVNGIGEPARATGVPALPQLSNPVSEFIPVARIADCLLGPGDTYEYNGNARTYPDLKMIYWAGGNPFHHHQNLTRLREAWQKPELIVVNESWWTSTARHADIIFPTSTALERNDIVCSGRDRFLTPSHRLREPFSGSRSDYEIFCALSQRLDVLDVFSEGRDEEAWLRDMYSVAQSRNSTGLALPEFDQFWAGGPLEFEPQAYAMNQILLADFRNDPEKNTLATPSGKIELFSKTIAEFGYADCPGHPTWLEPNEWLGSQMAKAHPLHLISNQPKTKLHSQYDLGSHCQASKQAGREVMRISAKDAAARGLKDGDHVRVFNNRGACLASVSISDQLRERVVQMSTGAWYDPDLLNNSNPLERHGNPNVLTHDIGASSLSQGTSAMTCLVEVERYDGALPEIEAFNQPEFRKVVSGALTPR
ncbi:MAG: molybdopterin-dependent oxidoreductase [Roseovarius sp.]